VRRSDISEHVNLKPFSMQLSITIHDTVTPQLDRVKRECASPAKLLRALGTSFATSAQDAFDDAAMRPSPWAPTKTGRKPLVNKGLLRRSIRVTNFTDSRVTVGTDRVYAVFHQLGTFGPYEIRAKNKKALAWPGAGHPVRKVIHPGLPARPFFPVDSSGNLVPAAARRMMQAGEAALQAMLKRG
jgi:phage gpG-like protein